MGSDNSDEEPFPDRAGESIPYTCMHDVGVSSQEMDVRTPQ